MSSGGGDGTGKLIATAVGAGLAGAALGISLFRWSESRKRAERDFHENMGRTSVIYLDDSARDADEMMVRRGSSTILFPHNHEEKMRRQVAARAAVEEENTMPRRSVTVRVPATSANMGPGCKFIIYMILFDV